MIPFLADKYNYDGLGMGGLADAISCKVTHEVNGIYELAMQYPITGINYDAIAPSLLIFAIPDSDTVAQPFRIYRITKPLNGVVTIYARHICYDMSGVIVEPFSAPTLAQTITAIPTHCTPAISFSIATNKSVSSPYTQNAPKELWRVLGGSEGSLLDLYGGEWDFNGMTATLKTRLGADRGVGIVYGKNMTELEQDTSLETTYAGVYPYWYDDATNTLVTITGGYVSTGSTLTDRIMLLDCSSDYDTQPTELQLTNRATAYITANDVADPKVSWKVNMALLSQSPEYSNIKMLENVALGDTVKVKYEALGVDASARVVKVDYDVLNEKYSNITVGRVKQNLAAILVSQNNKTEERINQVKNLTGEIAEKIEEGDAGYVTKVFDASGNWSELVISNTKDYLTATSVWRWNDQGLGHTTSYTGGQYNFALDNQGRLVANRIQVGTLQGPGSSSYWDFDNDVLNLTGSFTMTGGSVNINTSSGSVDVIKLTYSSGANTDSVALQPLGLYLRFTASTRDTNIQMTGNSGLTMGDTVLHNGVTLNHTLPQLYLGDGDAVRNSTLEDDRLIINCNSHDAVQIYGNPYAGDDSHGTINLLNGVQNKVVASLKDDTNRGNLTLTTVTDASDVTLIPTGLTFRNSGGTVTVKYPNDGYLKSVITNADNYTLNTSGYASVTKPAEVSGARKIVSADVYAYTSATGAFSVAGYNGNLTTAYIFGEPGVVINGLRIQFWYLDDE